MKTHTRASLLLLAGLLLSACGGDSSFAADSGNGSSASSSTFTPSGTVVPDGGRVLASQCFQCHGTDGRGSHIESLAGESERELIEEMREMKAENKSDIMHYQAKGYTDAQIRAIAAYISSLGGGNGGGSNDD